MRVLIIGGSGFIGTHVARQLVDLGHRVTNFHRGLTPSEPASQFEEIIGDRTNLKTYRKQFERLGAEVVVDMVAMTESDAKQLMSTFDGLVRRVVVISSADVYRNYELLRGVASAPADPQLLRETSPLRQNLFPYRKETMEPTNSFYNYEKILVERVVAGSAIATTILRLPCVYGPGDRQHRLRGYLKRMDDGRTAILLEREQINWRWTRGYVENVAAAICCAVGDAKSLSRIYNVGENTGLSEKEWIRSIGDSTGWTGRIIGADPLGLPKTMRTGLAWQHHLATDTSLIRRELGFSEPVFFEDGLSRTITWEREHPTSPSNSQDFDYSTEDQVLSLLMREAG